VHRAFLYPFVGRNDARFRSAAQWITVTNALLRLQKGWGAFRCQNWPFRPKGREYPYAMTEDGLAVLMHLSRGGTIYA
jgi:hypothetical protein